MNSKIHQPETGRHQPALPPRALAYRSPQQRQAPSRSTLEMEQLDLLDAITEELSAVSPVTRNHRQAALAELLSQLTTGIRRGAA
jgi:hypothetical protein